VPDSDPDPPQAYRKVTPVIIMAGINFFSVFILIIFLCLFTVKVDVSRAV